MNVEKHFANALKNLCASTPIDKVTVAAICTEADLSRQAFYSHYLDKYDLSVRIFEESFAPVAQGHRNRETTWLQSGVQHLSIYAENPAYYRNVLSSYDRASLRFHLNERMYGEFKHKCEMRGATFARDEEIYALKMVVMSTNELTFQWVEDGCKEPPEEIVRRFDLCRPLILAPYLEDNDSVVRTEYSQAPTPAMTQHSNHQKAPTPRTLHTARQANLTKRNHRPLSLRH